MTRIDWRIAAVAAACLCACGKNSSEPHVAARSGSAGEPGTGEDPGAGGNASGGKAGAADDVTLGIGAACGDDVAPEIGTAGAAEMPSSFRWCSTGPLITAVPDSDHPILSVKDPSVVYHDGLWHVFATTSDKNAQWSLVYLNFEDFHEAPNAKLFYLNDNPRLTGYHAAPQVFFFAPQKKWYLIFQSGQPQYTTNDDISQPQDWTAPVNFFEAEPQSVKDAKGSGGWLDFWVICDEASCYLFFTDDNGELFRSRTSIEDFPNGFDEPVIALQGTKETLFEGGATYHVQETGRYLTLVEALHDGGRYYRSFVSDTLDGEWSALADTWENPFAGQNNVVFASGAAWTTQVSHGELIRAGYDQHLDIALDGLRFLYQGVSRGTPQYYQLPYRLGLLTRIAPR